MLRTDVRRGSLYFPSLSYANSTDTRASHFHAGKFGSIRVILPCTSPSLSAEPISSLSPPADLFGGVAVKRRIVWTNMGNYEDDIGVKEYVSMHSWKRKDEGSSSRTTDTLTGVSSSLRTSSVLNSRENILPSFWNNTLK